MRLLMGLAGRRIGEGFLTVPAAEWFLARMDADVPLKVPSVCKLLPTVLEK